MNGIDKETLPIINSPNESKSFTYFDTEQDEMDKEKRTVLGKLRRITGEQENIEEMAKDLKANILVNKL